MRNDASTKRGFSRLSFLVRKMLAQSYFEVRLSHVPQGTEIHDKNGGDLQKKLLVMHSPLLTFIFISCMGQEKWLSIRLHSLPSLFRSCSLFVHCTAQLAVRWTLFTVRRVRSLCIMKYTEGHWFKYFVFDLPRSHLVWFQCGCSAFGKINAWYTSVFFFHFFVSSST